MSRPSPKVEKIFNASGEVAAVKLQADWAGEHECGIKELRAALGLDARSEIGIERYTVSPEIGMKEELFFLAERSVVAWKEGRKRVLKRLMLALVDPYWSAEYRPELYLHTDVLSGGFNERNALLFAKTEKDRQLLRDLVSHARIGDVAVYWQSGWGRPGLMIAIPSRIDAVYREDIALNHMNEAA